MTQPADDPTVGVIAFRRWARPQVAQLLASVSTMEAMVSNLGPATGSHGAKLVAALQEAYGAAGNLLADLAPWKDPRVAAPTGDVAEVVVIPDDSEADVDADEEAVLAAFAETGDVEPEAVR